MKWKLGEDYIGIIEGSERFYTIGIYSDITPIMENQMEKKMENAMETGNIWRIVGSRVSQN